MKRFTTNADGTVTSNNLGLIWSKTLLDGKDCTYEEAEKAIAALGPDWRMPTIDELLSLVDRSRYDPAIDTEAFPDTKSDWYWSNTPTAWNPSAVWVVLFDDGLSGDLHRDYLACVRAVRSSQ